MYLLFCYYIIASSQKIPLNHTFQDWDDAFNKLIIFYAFLADMCFTPILVIFVIDLIKTMRKNIIPILIKSVYKTRQ